MARKDYTYSRRQGAFVKRQTRQGVDYDKFATKEWALLISFFRWYPDILEDISEGTHIKYHNSLMNRVTKRYMARYAETFTYATRGYGKTTNLVSDKCNKGILWAGEITAYYAPTYTQAAPLASKAFADYEQNCPLLAAHYDKNSDAQTSFKVSTKNGSKFIMCIDRGIDTSGVVAEECSQEDKNPFNFSEFNQIVLGTNRLDHKINGESDPTHIDSQIHYITSAGRKENEAFTVYQNIRTSMQSNESAYALSIPWQVPVLCKMKRYSYYSMLKKRLTAEQFMRECETRCTGSTENPIIRDDVLRASRKLKVMEEKHCGKEDCFYILGYDVSSRDNNGNALTALSVVKCERQFDTSKWDNYRKAVVYAQDNRPPNSAREHALQIKRRWRDYCTDKSTAYIIIDARSYGQAVVEHLHENLGDGNPPFCTMNNEETFAPLVQPDAIPCVYAIQATGNSGRDPNSEMLDYIERQYENGNLWMLTGDTLKGIQAYKFQNNIKDDTKDHLIQLPYIATTKLCKQIANLQKKYTTTGWIEAPISRYIPKDIWSATLYACRLAQRLEKDELYSLNRASNQWEKYADEYQGDSGSISSKHAGVRKLGRGAIK